MLDDESSILRTIQYPQTDSSTVEGILQSARRWSRQIQSDGGKSSALETLVSRIGLQSDGLRISIKLPLAQTGAPLKGFPAEVTLTQFFPMRMTRRGIELRLVVENRQAPVPNVDLTLLKAIARAHSWFAEISSGKTPSLARIGARESISVRYVSRLIRLAFLSPEIVESIVRGNQPSDLTVQALTRHITIPVDWRSQRAALKFSVVALG